jgi:hypothetical protein
MSKGELQMTLFSGAVAVLTVAGLAYIFAVQPDYLRTDRDGVPYFTSAVKNPVTDETVDMTTLVRHYRGETP